MTHSYVCSNSCVRVHLSLSSTCISIFATLSYNSAVCVPWLLHSRTMTHSYVSSNSCACVHLSLNSTCISILATLSYDSSIFVPWLWHSRTMTHSYVCSNFCVRVHLILNYTLIFILATLFMTLVCLCAMTLSYVCQDSCMRVPWLLGVCAPLSELYNDIYFRHSFPSLLCICTMTLSYVRQDSCMHVPWLLGVCSTQMWSQVSRVFLMFGFKCLIRVSFVCTSVYLCAPQSKAHADVISSVSCVSHVWFQMSHSCVICVYLSLFVCTSV